MQSCMHYIFYQKKSNTFRSMACIENTNKIWDHDLFLTLDSCSLIPFFFSCCSSLHFFLIPSLVLDDDSLLLLPSLVFSSIRFWVSFYFLLPLNTHFSFLLMILLLLCLI